MSYGFNANVSEYQPGQVPVEYRWKSVDLMRNTGWKKSTMWHYCSRLHNPLPYVAERRGMSTMWYFNPRQVAQWMKEEAVRKGFLSQ